MYQIISKSTNKLTILDYIKFCNVDFIYRILLFNEIKNTTQFPEWQRIVKVMFMYPFYHLFYNKSTDVNPTTASRYRYVLTWWVFDFKIII